jgi:predicted PurR-regulated permease PerM
MSVTEKKLIDRIELLENTIKSYENIIQNNSNEISSNIELMNINDRSAEEKSIEKNSADAISAKIDHDYKQNFLSIVSEFIYLFITTVLTAIILYFLIKIIEFIDSGDV